MFSGAPISAQSHEFRLRAAFTGSRHLSPDALVGISGASLTTFHFLDIDHDASGHAAAIFTVSVAVRGVGAVFNLYYMDIALKEQRVNGIAVARSFVRVAMISLLATLAAVAHLHEAAWAILFITVVSFGAAAFSYVMTRSSNTGRATRPVDSQ